LGNNHDLHIPGEADDALQPPAPQQAVPRQLRGPHEMDLGNLLS